MELVTPLANYIKQITSKNSRHLIINSINYRKNQGIIHRKIPTSIKLCFIIY